MATIDILTPEATIKRIIEETIDAIDLDMLLGLVAAVCLEKADHIAESYNDLPWSRTWRTAGETVDAFARNPKITAVS